MLCRNCLTLTNGDSGGSRISQGGVRRPQGEGGAPTYYLAKTMLKTARKKRKKLDRGWYISSGLFLKEDRLLLEKRSFYYLKSSVIRNYSLKSRKKDNLCQISKS